MTLPARGKRWVGTGLMGSGTVVVMASVLDLLRSMIGGPFANLVPNLPLGPTALLFGAGAIVVGAVARRRATRHVPSIACRD